MGIKESLGGIKESIEDIKDNVEDIKDSQEKCVKVADDHEKRIGALETDKTGPNLKTIGAAGGVGGAGAIAITLLTILFKYMGWM